jgi:putative ABC transport system permease protein
LVLVPRRDQRLPAAQRQLWVGATRPPYAELAAAALPLARLASIDDLRAGAVYEPVTFTFQYLIALSVFTGLIAVVGLLLYLESRTAVHRRAYVLLRRLGLRSRAHRRALVIELGAPVLVGLIAGLGLAAGLAAMLGGEFEVDHGSPPNAILVLPWAMVTVVCVTPLVIAAVAASFAHHRVRRANPSEVLRDAP